MPDGLYDADILAWSEQQADLLRRLARGERVNDAIHWANVVDEVETVGRSELRACESLLLQGILHLLKLRAWPESVAAAHWRGEATGFLLDAKRAFSPSMRQMIDLADMHRDAMRRLEAAGDGSGSPEQVPETCPFTLDDLLAADFEVGALVRRLGAGRPS